jgi:hypothetical protein
VREDEGFVLIIRVGEGVVTFWAVQLFENGTPRMLVSF